MTAPDPRHAALVLGLLDVFAKRTAELSKQARSIAVTDYFRPGERTTIVDPVDGRTLGKVWMTAPKAVAEVDDLAALTSYLADEVPDAVKTSRPIVGDVLEIAAVLAEHAPHLLGDVEVHARPWAVEEAKAAALRGQLSPGVVVRQRNGAMTVKLDPGAAERYRELVAQGAVDPLAELPAASVETSKEAA